MLISPLRLCRTIDPGFHLSMGHPLFILILYNGKPEGPSINSVALSMTMGIGLMLLTLENQTFSAEKKCNRTTSQ